MSNLLQEMTMRRKIFFLTFLLTASLIILFTSLPVEACQLICLRTRTAYNGNLGGIAGADAKCATEYPGFKAARTTDIIFNIASSSDASSSGVATIGKDTWDVKHPTNNCSGYTATAGSGTATTACPLETCSAECHYNAPPYDITGNSRQYTKNSCGGVFVEWHGGFDCGSGASATAQGTDYCYLNGQFAPLTPSTPSCASSFHLVCCNI